MLTPTRQFLLSKLPPQILSGYYIDSEDGQPNPLHVYCFAHASQVAKRWGRVRKTETYVCGCWAGSDSGVERCAIKTCDIALDCGGMTSYGIDSALALTEENPWESPVSVEELHLTAESMMPDDKRWAIWDHHLLNAIRALRDP